MSKRKKASEFQIADALVVMLADQVGRRRFLKLSPAQRHEINEDCLVLARKVAAFEVPK